MRSEHRSRPAQPGSSDSLATVSHERRDGDERAVRTATLTQSEYAPVDHHRPPDSAGLGITICDRLLSSCTVTRVASNVTLSAALVSTRRSVHLTSVVGWTLLGCGIGVLAYLAYALLFTNITTGQAQDELRDHWRQQVQAAPRTDPVAATPLGTGIALIEFVRPGSDRALVHDGPLVVIEGVTGDDLAKGPGHYPDTALPGQPGNFAVAGHRTTHGAPFFHLDAVRAGDEILVTDRRGTQHTYEVTRQRVVLPTDAWVIGEDPLSTGKPTLTLTTCNPRFSAAERLVIHAELVS